MLRHSLTRIGPPAPDFHSLHPNGFLLNAPILVYAYLIYQDQSRNALITSCPHIVIRKIVNLVTLTRSAQEDGNYKGYVFRTTMPSRRHTNIYDYRHEIGKRYTDKSLLTAVSRISKKQVVYDPSGQVKSRKQSAKRRSHTMSRNPLGRLGHNLSIREYLAGFIIAPYTRDVLPWLVGHVAVRVVQRNDVLDRRQELKLGPLCLIMLSVSRRRLCGHT